MPYKNRLTKKDTSNNTVDSNYDLVCEFSNVPNARHLFRAMKRYCGDIEIIYNLNSFNVNVSKDKLIQIISEIFESRFIVTISDEDTEDVKKKSDRKIKSVKAKCKTTK